MVAPIVTYGFTAAFLSGVVVLTVGIVWMSLRNSAHTPNPLRSDGSG